jgi:beta-carotene 3-hydroxylase
MEFVAWFTHKYVMHGFLWSWHASHHSIRKGIFERNDLFAIVFSIPAIVLIILGSHYSIYEIMFIGFGITAYGIFYLIFHDNSASKNTDKIQSKIKIYEADHECSLYSS